MQLIVKESQSQTKTTERLIALVDYNGCRLVFMQFSTPQNSLQKKQRYSKIILPAWVPRFDFITAIYLFHTWAILPSNVKPLYFQTIKKNRIAKEKLNLNLVSCCQIDPFSFYCLIKLYKMNRLKKNFVTNLGIVLTSIYLEIFLPVHVFQFFLEVHGNGIVQLVILKLLETQHIQKNN